MRLLPTFAFAPVVSLRSRALPSTALASTNNNSSSDNDYDLDLHLTLPLCTKEQKEPYEVTYDDQLTNCAIVRLGYFQWCDDECLALYQRLADIAPSCIPTKSIPYETLKELYDGLLESCQAQRANTTGKYIPKRPAPGTANCTIDLAGDWRFSFGSAAEECDYTTRATRKCSDECLKVIETSVDQAPMCTKKAYIYSMHEDAKDFLVNCLQTRGDDLKTNAVLQSAVISNKNGSSSRNSAQTTASPDAKSMADSPAPITITVAITSSVMTLLLVSA